MVALPLGSSPPMLNKSWTITADIEVFDGGNGMIVTEGGLEGGFGLYLRDGKPTFVYNFLGAIVPRSRRKIRCRRARRSSSSTSPTTGADWGKAEPSP